MATPSESSTQLNAGTGGDVIRDFVITRPDGTQVKVQGVAIVDASYPNNVALVDDNGRIFIRADELFLIEERILKMLRRIAGALENAFDLTPIFAEEEDLEE